MNSTFNILTFIRILVTLVCLTLLCNLISAQDNKIGTFSDRVYENKHLGFMIKNIPEKWNCLLNPQLNSVLNPQFPIFGTLGDSTQVLAEFTDTTKKTSNNILRIYLIVESTKSYESKGVKTVEEYFQHHKIKCFRTFLMRL